MDGIVIVGNGVAGISAALAARARDPAIPITVIGEESDHFFARTALMYAFLGRIERRALEPHPRRLYDDRRIRRVRDRVVNVDATARQLRLHGGGALGYERLLIATGSRPQTLLAPGLEEARDGVASFVRLGDLDCCERLASTAAAAVVVGGGLIGVELVECLRHHGKQVVFLVREPWYWPAALGREEGEMVSAHLRAHGVVVRTGEELGSVAVDGAGRVAAITTRSGERLACQMLGVAVGVTPDTGWLLGVSTPPRLGRGVRVDARLRTSLPGVLAAGDCAEVDVPALPAGPPRDLELGGLCEQTWYAARRQGELAGRNLTGADEEYRPGVYYNSARFFAIDYTTVGGFGARGEALRSLYRRDPGREASQRIVHDGRAVLGFSLLGSRWDHEVLIRWIEEQRPPSWVVTHLAEAQFDGELGRARLGGPADMVDSAWVPW